MKINVTILAFIISVCAIAQNGINYKAIIKDGSGNIISNDLVVVQFTILEGTTDI